jgi:hypothetical protein
MTTSPFTKTYIPTFETIGKRKQLVGFVGELRDESGTVLSAQLYDTKPEAETALDNLTHELLIDYAERGLIDTLPAQLLDPPGENPMGDEEGDEPPEWRAVAERLAQSLANITRVPTHVVAQNGAYLVQDEADLDCYGGRAAIVASFQPEPPRAVTVQSIIIESKITTCANCQGIHATYKCPELWTVLRLESWTGAELGRALCRLRWRDFTDFIDLLLSAAPTRVLEYAMSYQAFIRENNPASTLTINEVLTVWSREMRGERFNVALSQVDVRAA